MAMCKNPTILLLGGLLLAFAMETCGQLQQSNTMNIKVPDCEYETFCESTVDYPIQTVVKALKKNPHLRYYAKADEMQKFLRGEKLTMDLSARPGDGPEEEPLCVSTEQIVFPKIAKTKNSEWMYIVNHENLTQSVRIEKCLEEGKPCRVIEGIAEGYVTRCKQKYIYRQLLAVTSDGLINQYSFQFPASCCCHIEFQAEKFLKSIDFD